MTEPYGRTKSKWLAFFLTWLLVGDLYLGYPKLFFKKLLICFTLVGIIWIAFQSWADMFKIATGKIDCDANGIPLV